MKLGPVTNLYKKKEKIEREKNKKKKKKTTSKKIDDDIMSTNYDVIVIFMIYGQFGAIPKPDSGRIVCKT